MAMVSPWWVCGPDTQRAAGPRPLRKAGGRCREFEYKDSPRRPARSPLVVVGGWAHSGAVDAPREGQPDESTGLITVVDEADGQVLHLTGDVDVLVLSQLASEHAVDRLRILAVDVGALGYIDSTGLGFLARWAQAAQEEGRPAEVRRATPRFERVLEVSGLASMFHLT
jgi:anti-anti-sigma factor